MSSSIALDWNGTVCCIRCGAATNGRPCEECHYPERVVFATFGENCDCDDDNLDDPDDGAEW